MKCCLAGTSDCLQSPLDSFSCFKSFWSLQNIMRELSALQTLSKNISKTVTVSIPIEIYGIKSGNKKCTMIKSYQIQNKYKEMTRHKPANHQINSNILISTICHLATPTSCILSPQRAALSDNWCHETKEFP